jgi:hypothetical protein
LSEISRGVQQLIPVVVYLNPLLGEHISDDAIALFRIRLNIPIPENGFCIERGCEGWQRLTRVVVQNKELATRLGIALLKALQTANHVTYSCRSHIIPCQDVGIEAEDSYHFLAVCPCGGESNII